MVDVILADCLDYMKTIPDDSIDIVFTSPPYANQRNKTYGGVDDKEYISWFLEIASEIKRILKPSGSFFLNIKSHIKNGERSLYVYKLLISLKEDCGFKFIDEFCWTKLPFPGNYHGRFKNAFEPIFHFGKFDKITELTFNPLACGTNIKDVTINRARFKCTAKPKNNSGMIRHSNNFANLELARPSNVVSINNIVNQNDSRIFHPAVFPVRLAEFFIKSFSNEGDVVLDPFSGSGTVGLVCIDTNRNGILIEKKEEYYIKSKELIQNYKKRSLVITDKKITDKKHKTLW